MILNIYAQTLIPLAILGHYPGVTLFIAFIMLFFTIKPITSKNSKIKLWGCVLFSIFYGFYDIGFYLYADANIRLDLMLLGPCYYFSLLYWAIIKKQEHADYVHSQSMGEISSSKKK